MIFCLEAQILADQALINALTKQVKSENLTVALSGFYSLQREQNRPSSGVIPPSREFAAVGGKVKRLPAGNRATLYLNN